MEGITQASCINMDAGFIVFNAIKAPGGKMFRRFVEKAFKELQADPHWLEPYYGRPCPRNKIMQIVTVRTE